MAGRLEINISKHQTIDDKINNVAFLIQIITTRLIIVMEHTYLLLLRKLMSITKLVSNPLVKSQRMTASFAFVSHFAHGYGHLV